MRLSNCERGIRVAEGGFAMNFGTGWIVLVAWVIPLLIVWVTIYTAVLAALRRHARD
jgi:hypothetical protein